VPVNSRTAIRPTTLPIGGGPNGTAPLLVRKGETVAYSVYTMHRRKDIYGEDAEFFKPERWENDKLANVGWAYLPFNGGPRVCLGRTCYPSSLEVLSSIYPSKCFLHMFKSSLLS